MARLGRTVFLVFGIVIAALLIGLAYLFFAFPKVGKARDVKIESSPARLERGKYLANHVAVCLDCHSTRDWSRYAGPVVLGTEGRGGEKFGREMGFPGDIYAPNITPAELKSWSDGEIIRATTEGVARDGRALFPVMPYPNLASLCDEDLASVVAYLRSLQAIPSDVPQTRLEFPMNLIVRTIPAPAKAGACVDARDPVAYGRYLVTIASCGDCHTRHDHGTPVAGMEFAGGSEFRLPTGTARSANITPEVETGIGAWSADGFVARFKRLSPESAGAAPVVKAGEPNTVMPWTQYYRMTEPDLRAIYGYLHTLKPVKHRVVKFSP